MRALMDSALPRRYSSGIQTVAQASSSGGGDPVAGWKFWSRASRARVPLNPRQEALFRLDQQGARLWVSAAVATSLTAIAFLAVTLPRIPDPRYALWYIQAEQAAPALLGLVLLFNTNLLYRRWHIRQQRKELTATSSAEEPRGASSEVALIDSVTGLSNQKAAEQQLGRELALAKRMGEPLSLLAIGLDDFKGLDARYGRPVADRVLQDFTRQLRKATRGSDFAVRLAGDEFLAVLPGCPMANVQRVVNRMEPVAANCNGTEVQISYITAWLDPQPGESPSEFTKRAQEMLRLYKNVDPNASASGPN